MPYHPPPHDVGKPLNFGFRMLRREGEAEPRRPGRDCRRPNRNNKEAFLAQRLDIALVDRVLRGQANLTDGTFVEIDLHELNGEYANHPGRVNARVNVVGVLC